MQADLPQVVGTERPAQSSVSSVVDCRGLSLLVVGRGLSLLVVGRDLSLLVVGRDLSLFDGKWPR